MIHPEPSSAFSGTNKFSLTVEELHNITSLTTLLRNTNFNQIANLNSIKILFQIWTEKQLVLWWSGGKNSRKRKWLGEDLTGRGGATDEEEGEVPLFSLEQQPHLLDELQRLNLLPSARPASLPVNKRIRDEQEDQR